MICLEWLLSTEICWYFHYSCSKLTSHACALLIDNVGNYLYLNNGSFKSEVDPHQFNPREKKEVFKSWQVCDWLAKWLIVLGFMDLRWPWVYRRSNVGLVHTVASKWNGNEQYGIPFVICGFKMSKYHTNCRITVTTRIQFVCCGLILISTSTLNICFKSQSKLIWPSGTICRHNSGQALARVTNEIMLTYHQKCSVAFTPEKAHRNLISNMCSDITLL